MQLKLPVCLCSSNPGDRTQRGVDKGWMQIIFIKGSQQMCGQLQLLQRFAISPKGFLRGLKSRAILKAYKAPEYFLIAKSFEMRAPQRPLISGILNRTGFTRPFSEMLSLPWQCRIFSPPRQVNT